MDTDACVCTHCTVADSTSRDQNQRAESDTSTVPGVVHVVCKEKIASKIAP